MGFMNGDCCFLSFVVSSIESIVLDNHIVLLKSHKYSCFVGFYIWMLKHKQIFLVIHMDHELVILQYHGHIRLTESREEFALYLAALSWIHLLLLALTHLYLPLVHYLIIRVHSLHSEPYLAAVRLVHFKPVSHVVLRLSLVEHVGLLTLVSLHTSVIKGQRETWVLIIII